MPPVTVANARAPQTREEARRQRGEEPAGAVGYAALVSSLIPLSVTGVVLFTACLVLVVLAGLGIFALLRGRRGE